MLLGSDLLPSMKLTNQLRLGAALGGILALLATYGALHVPCLFSTVTGIQCPSCGLTRSVVAVLRGDLALSIAYHPAGIALVSVVFVALLVPEQTLRAWGGVSERWRALPIVTRAGIGIGLLLMVWTWNLTRIIPG